MSQGTPLAPSPQPLGGSRAGRRKREYRHPRSVHKETARPRDSWFSTRHRRPGQGERIDLRLCLACRRCPYPTCSTIASSLPFISHTTRKPKLPSPRPSSTDPDRASAGRPATRRRRGAMTSPSHPANRKRAICSTAVSFRHSGHGCGTRKVSEVPSHRTVSRRDR